MKKEGYPGRMVDPALLERVDLLDTDALDELIDYAQAKRSGEFVLTAEQRETLRSRRNDLDPTHWLTDEEFDARLDLMTA